MIVTIVIYMINWKSDVSTDLILAILLTIILIIETASFLVCKFPSKKLVISTKEYILYLYK